MKNLSSILLGIFCLVLGGLSFNSCCGNEGSEEEVKPNYDPSISVWYKEFETIKNMGIFGSIWGCNLRLPELKLTDYTYKGVYDTPEKLAQLREAIFSDDTYVPAYRGSFDEFTLETWDQIIANEPDNIDPDWWIPVIDSIIQLEPEVIELHWTYENKLNFTTYALVSPFRIHYDNILWFLIYKHSGQSTKSTEIERGILPTKSSSENDSDTGISNEGKKISHTEEYKVSTTGPNNKTYYSKVTCTLKGEIRKDYYIGDDNKPYYILKEYITDRELTTSHNTEGSNYQAVGMVTETQYISGFDGYVSYSYACGIANKNNSDGSSNTISLSYTGGGSYSFTGTFIDKEWGTDAIQAVNMD